MIRRRVLIRGRVQGVFFRDGCRQQADRSGVTGWVANRPDGTVEAVLEGSEEAVTRLVEWCRHGPPHARVEDVEVAEEPAEALRGFVVR